MKSFLKWISEQASDSLVEQLKDLLKEPQEIAGYIKNNKICFPNKGQEGGVIMGHADSIRSSGCDYTFHTHPRSSDVPYPSADDMVAVYMTGKTDLLVCRVGIWSVAPQKKMDWQDVENISQDLKKQSKNYWDWKDKVKQIFPVRIEKIHAF